jgi:predicted dehydrogenase
MTNGRPQSALVVGAGSIGRRHLSNLRQLGVTRLSACDPHADRLAYVNTQFQAEGFADIETALERSRPDIVLVCSPPSCHVKHAVAGLLAGSPVFLEKPVADNAEDLGKLLDARRATGLTVQVGYNLRFHPAVKKLKELVETEAVGKIQWGRVESGSYLPNWRPWQDYRLSYTARRELGGGIILDGSHELDYVTWLFGAPSELTCMAGTVSKLEINVEDCATVLLRYPNGSQLDVHMDFMQRFYTRGCVLAGDDGKLQWDFSGNSIQWQRTDEQTQTINFQCEVNEMYLAELEHFLNCIEQGTAPRFSLEDGILTLRVALAARRAAEERRWLSLE